MITESPMADAVPAWKQLARAARRLAQPVMNVLHQAVLTPINRIRHARKPYRCLEIGPGLERIDGFETLSVRAAKGLDYVADASRRMPFATGTFDLVYASHVLEHVPWYHLERTVCDWVRILKPSGVLEIWTPDGLKIARAFTLAEDAGATEFEEDGWFKFNPSRDPCVWANGRVFSYGDGDGRKSSPNWHMSLISPRYLRQLMTAAGLVGVEPMDTSQVRGHDHGWINLGMRGHRP